MAQKEAQSGFVKWFSELSKKDIAIAGGKGANLGEMYNIKMPIPPGFAITAQAYVYFIQKTGIDVKIKQILSELNVEDTQKLNIVSKTIREIIEQASLPEEMKLEIVEAYGILDTDSSIEESEDISKLLKKKDSRTFVVVRSSATAEDLADASFAGQQETFVNVRGNEDLLDKVKKCMSSLFTARAIYYRAKKGFYHDKTYLSVIVQKMINSEKSGVIFSKNPANKNNNVVIEAVWGLGEGIVSGQINPDYYSINPNLENFKIEEISIGRKKIAIIRNEEGKTETIRVNHEQSKKQVLTNYEIKRLAQYALQLEEHYKKPQDIEFAIDKTGIYIVQSRPITTLSKKTEEGELEGEVLLSGFAASPGVASGIVKIIHSLSELEKVQKGDVLVTEMTNPDMVVAMERASAIVTDEGGITSHAAIVSREMGIPCVVGTDNATKKLKEGEAITVDGNSGKVLAGKSEARLIKIEPIVPTKTEIKVIVDLPHSAERAAKSKVRAVGLTRLEGIIAEGGKHPMYFVNKNDMKDYIKLIADGITKIAALFEEIWIRTSDIRSDEYKNLEGAPQIVEGNPMLGDHGIRFSLKHKDIMKAELLAVKEVAHFYPSKKFGIMIPQVISVSEVRETKKLSHELEIPENIKIGIMVETPAAVQIIEDLCKEGISFISFGTNDLTQYTLAIDRNNEHVQQIYDETHPAVMNSIKQVIKICKKYGVKTSICGQAASREEMARTLVAEGIDSLSVNADAARRISLFVAQLEGSQLPKQIIEEPQHSLVQEKETPKQEIKIEKPRPLAVTKNQQEMFEDIEQVILRELEEKNEYLPGNAEKKEKKDIPSLNDAIPVDSELFEEGG